MISLHEKAIECVKNYKRSEKALIDVLIEIDQEKTYLKHGCSSLFTYCVKCLGLSEGESYRFIQVERKAIQVPELKSAIGSGALTVSQASRIAPVLNTSNPLFGSKRPQRLPRRKLKEKLQRSALNRKRQSESSH